MLLQYLQSEKGKSSLSLISNGKNKTVMCFHSNKEEQTFLGRQEIWVLVLALPITHYDVCKPFTFSG